MKANIHQRDMTYREDDAAESFKDENWRDEVVQWILVDGLHTHRHEFLRLGFGTYVSHIKSRNSSFYAMTK